MHRLHVFQPANPLPFAPAQEGSGSPPVGGPRVRVAYVDGEELDEAPCSPFPCPGNQSRKRRPGRLIVNGNESAPRSHRSYTSLRWRMRVTSTSNFASSMVYTTRYSPTRMRHS